jgi:AcrR family transcriptional regulator
VRLQVTGPPAPETLRPHLLARRQRIVDSAVKALKHSDYESIKIQDVAQGANVALGTVYRYFASKEHLFAAAFLEWQEALKLNLDKRALEGMTEQERLSDIMRRSVHAAELQPQFLKLVIMMRTTTDPYAVQIFSTLGGLYSSTLARARDEPPDERFRIINVTVQAVYMTALEEWVMGRLPIHDVYRRVEDAIKLAYGLLPFETSVVDHVPAVASGPGPADGRPAALSKPRSVTA